MPSFYHSAHLAVARARQDDDAELPLAEHPSWLQIGRGWPVLDRDGVMLGFIVRIRGDRNTGTFDGVDVARSLESAELHIPSAAVAAIGRGKITLAVAKLEL